MALETERREKRIGLVTLDGFRHSPAILKNGSDRCYPPIPRGRHSSRLLFLQFPWSIMNLHDVALPRAPWRTVILRIEPLFEVGETVSSISLVSSRHAEHCNDRADGGDRPICVALPTNEYRHWRQCLLLGLLADHRHLTTGRSSLLQIPIALTVWVDQRFDVILKSDDAPDEVGWKLRPVQHRERHAGVGSLGPG